MMSVGDVWNEGLSSSLIGFWDGYRRGLQRFPLFQIYIAASCPKCGHPRGGTPPVPYSSLDAGPWCTKVVSSKGPTPADDKALTSWS